MEDLHKGGQFSSLRIPKVPPLSCSLALSRRGVSLGMLSALLFDKGFGLFALRFHKWSLGQKGLSFTAMLPRDVY